jgi:orotidine-5'-phosphate decarboxylase
MPNPLVPVGPSRSIAIAADVQSLPDLVRLVSATKNCAAVSAVKVGFTLALRYGLQAVVATIKSETTVPIIYDHQKAGTDIPQMGRPFATACREAGVDGIIIFPHAGPRTLEAFVSAALESDLNAIAGLMMTHSGYLASDGGYLVDAAPSLICEAALRLGVTHFVLPGTNPAVVRHFSTGPFRDGCFTLWMPGIGAQGGSLAEAFEAAKPNRAVGIIGSAIYASADPQRALAAFANEMMP